jgi:thioredoxin-dependent peroxiredoxin
MAKFVEGEPAPDFTLPGTGGRDYTLSDYRGRPVVLVVYPADDSPVCTKQLCSYRDRIEDFAKLDAQILAISVQDVDRHEAFAAKRNLPFPLLADPQRSVIRKLGALGLGSMLLRAVVLIDAEGIVRHRHVGLSTFYSKPEDLLERLQALEPATAS